MKGGVGTASLPHKHSHLGGFTVEHIDINDISLDSLRHAIIEKQGLQRRETEDYLRESCVTGYSKRQERFWNRDYSSFESYQASIEPNRRRWQAALGYSTFIPEGDFEPIEELYFEDDHVIATWISIRFGGYLRCRAIFALPKQRSSPVPLVIAPHGYTSAPDDVFLSCSGKGYDSYGYRLSRNGFAVLMPLHITEAIPRARYTRMSLVLGGTLFGLEISKLKRFLDYILALDQVDSERVGMWGLSLGGTYTLITLPAEARIKAGVISAYFNHRLTKMAVEDIRYTSYLSTEEEHAFIPGWLREFSDRDLVSLICPKPLMIQTGKADWVSWWPDVVQEFKAAKAHYRKLDCAERLQLDLHEGGHEIRWTTGIEFLKRWL